MGLVDMTQPTMGPGQFKPGLYRAEVAQAVDKSSAKGDPMFNIALKAIDFPGVNGFLCFDNVMLAGPGWGIGKSKLQVLRPNLPADFKGELSPSELLGRRCIVRVIYQKNQNGEDRLAVDIRAPASHCGYYDEVASPPEPLVTPVAPADETPF